MLTQTIHKHYGELVFALALTVLLFAVFSRPRPVLQRIAAVLIDINLVLGAIHWCVIYPKSVSLLHPLLALAAVGLAHASARSDDRKKVITFWSLVVILLLTAWAVHAPWGPAALKNIWMVGGAPAA
jgi:hypothetical protein